MKRYCGNCEHWEYKGRFGHGSKPEWGFCHLIRIVARASAPCCGRYSEARAIPIHEPEVIQARISAGLPKPKGTGS